MQPWTATGFVLGACGLALAAFKSLMARVASTLSAAALAFVGGSPLLQHATGQTFGTDTWLFPTAVLTAQTHIYSGPGRISQSAAIGLTALAVALLLAPRTNSFVGRTAFSLLATTALALAVVGILWYILRLEPFDAWFPRNPLAVHSALALAALSIGVLALRPDVGWLRVAAEQGPIGWTAALLFAAGGLLLVSGTDAATRTGSVAVDAADAFRQLEVVLSNVKDAETGQRGYLLTNRDSYLTPYQAAHDRLPGSLSAAATALGKVSNQTASLAHLQSMIADKMSELADTISLHQSGHTEEALKLVESDRGKATMDGMRKEADLLLQMIADDAGHRVVLAQRIATTAAAGVMALVGLAFWALATARRAQKQAALSLAVSTARQQDLLATLKLGTFMAVSLDGVIQYWGDGCERLYGWTAGQAVGRWSTEMLGTIYPIPRPAIMAILQSTGDWNGEVRQNARDGQQLVVKVHKSLRRASNGRPAMVLEALTDVTAQSRAETALRENQTLLHTIIETTPGLIYAKDRQGRMLMANSAVVTLIGRPWAEIMGQTDKEFLNNPEQGEVVSANDRQVMETGSTQELEELVSEPNGPARIWLSTKTPMRDADGQVVGLVGVSIDITERKRDEERLRLMVNELNHRVKNTLATVQSITSQTLRSADATVHRTLVGRLQALAAVHDVLTRESWKEASLHDVIEVALAPYGGTANGRFKVSGESIRLQPRIAVALSLALHELATNANKYGALSSPHGQVMIRWDIIRNGEPRLQMVWSETGGPPVVSDSTRGFGTRLIERSLAQDLGGTAKLRFDADGVTCTVDAALNEVEATADVIDLSQFRRTAGNYDRC